MVANGEVYDVLSCPSARTATATPSLAHQPTTWNILIWHGQAKTKDCLMLLVLMLIDGVSTQQWSTCVLSTVPSNTSVLCPSHRTYDDIVISSISRQSVGRRDSDGGQTSRKRQLLTFVMTVLSKARELLPYRLLSFPIPSSQCIHTCALFGRFPHPCSADLHPVTRMHDTGIMCSLDLSQFVRICERCTSSADRFTHTLPVVTVLRWSDLYELRSQTKP